MRKLTLLLLAIVVGANVIMAEQASWNRDFSVTVNGKTLYFKNNAYSQSEITYAILCAPIYRSNYYWYGNVDGLIAPAPTGTIVVPDSVVNNYGMKIPVKHLESNAFRNCSGITSITLPNTITYIGNYAFNGCSGITSISIPNSVTQIGQGAFYGTNLTSLTIPPSVFSLSPGSLACHNLTTVNYNASYAMVISSSANGSIQMSPVSPFKLYISDYSGSQLVVDSVVSPISTVNIGSNVHCIPNSFLREIGTITNITIPDGISEIGEYAFAGTSLGGTFTIPASVVRLGRNALEGTNITTLNYNAPRASMGYYTISINWSTYTADTIWNVSGPLCTSITNLNIGNNVEYIPAGFLYGDTLLTSFAIPSSVQNIGNRAFCNTGIQSVNIPVSIDTIGSYAFATNHSISVNYAGSLEQYCNIKMGEYAFCNEAYDETTNEYNVLNYDLYIDGNAVRNLVIPTNVTTVRECQFLGCNLNSITIPNHVTAIGYEAFSSSSAENVIIGNGITNLANGAFRDCINITNLTLGSSVSSIDYSAFYGCTSLEEITSFNPTAPLLGEYTFRDVNNTIPINIPCGSTPSYLSRWSYFSNFVEMSANSFEAYSADETMGTVQILTAPTCTAPTAVIYANANNGYRFDYWSDGNTDNPRTLTVVSDTVIVGHFASTDAIEPTDGETVTISTTHGTITVSGAAGECIRLFDLSGRLLAVHTNAVETQTFAVRTTGTYFVQVGNRAAQKVVIVH